MKSIKQFYSVIWIVAAIIFLTGAMARGEDEPQARLPLPFEVIHPEIKNTEGIALCPNGRLFIGLNRDSKVVELTDNDEIKDFASINGSPVGMACDKDNILYVDVVGTSTDKGFVCKVTMDGKIEKIGSGGMTLPNGVVAAPDGSILVSDSGGNAIYRIDAQGVQTVWIPKINAPNGMDFSPDHKYLYVNNTFSNTTSRIPVDEMLTPGPVGKFVGGINVADGLMVLPDGDILIVAFNAGTIFQVKPDGTKTELGKGMKSCASPAIKGDKLYLTNLMGSGLYRIKLPNAPFEEVKETSSKETGESMDTAIVIHAENESDGVKAEYDYLARKYGKRGTDWEVKSQSLQGDQSGNYDVITIELPDGTFKDVFFGISEFLGKY